MRTTLTIDDDIHQAAVHLSRLTGRRLGTVLSELARRGLAGGTPAIRKGKGRFPVFDVPPDATIIPASRAQECLDEEGFF